MFKKLIIGCLLNLYLSIGICHSYDFDNQEKDNSNTLLSIGFGKKDIFFNAQTIEILLNQDFNVNAGSNPTIKNTKNYLKNVILETINLFLDETIEKKQITFLQSLRKAVPLADDDEFKIELHQTGFNPGKEDLSNEAKETAKLLFEKIVAAAKVDAELIQANNVIVRPVEDLLLFVEEKEEDKVEVQFTATKSLLERAIALNIDKEKVSSLLEGLDASENKGSFLNKIDSERFGSKKDKTLLQKVDNRLAKHQDGGKYHSYGLKADEQIGAFHGFLKEARVPQKPDSLPSSTQLEAVKLVQDIIGLYNKEILKSSEDNSIRTNLFNKEGIELIFKDLCALGAEYSALDGKIIAHLDH